MTISVTNQPKSRIFFPGTAAPCRRRPFLVHFPGFFDRLGRKTENGASRPRFGDQDNASNTHIRRNGSDGCPWTKRVSATGGWRINPGILQPCRCGLSLMFCKEYSNGKCHHASAAGSRRAFRSPDPLLESQDGSFHFRSPRQDPHHQPRKNPAPAHRRDEFHQQAGGQARLHHVRRHQARSQLGHRGRSAALWHAVCIPPLAGRHADQLSNHPCFRQAPEATGKHARGRQRWAPGQERSAAADPRARQARAQPGRHQGHEEPARRPVRGRRKPRGHCHRGSPQAGHPRDRHRRYQLLAGRYRLRHPGQRRRHPLDSPVYAAGGRCRVGRPCFLAAGRGGRRVCRAG